MTLIRHIDAESMIDDAEAHLVIGFVVLPDDLDFGFVGLLALLIGVAQQIL